MIEARTRLHNMQDSRDFTVLSVHRRVIGFAAVVLLITSGARGELSESESFFRFVRAVDPESVTGLELAGNASLHPCSCRLNGVSVKCDSEVGRITEVRLEHLNLTGVIDANSLCELRDLEYLSLADNLIRGNIPESIGNCISLITLNLSSNSLSGRVPDSLRKLRKLSTLDLSNNELLATPPNVGKRAPGGDLLLQRKSNYRRKNSLVSRKLFEADSPSPSNSKPEDNSLGWLPLVFGIAFCFLVMWIIAEKAAKVAEEKQILIALSNSPVKFPPPRPIEEINPEEGRSELVFFVNEHEAFKLDDLLEAEADLRSQRFCSSLYKVALKNNTTYAVKRLKKLQVSFEEFGKTMRKIGNMKHPNILPLVGYNSSSEEKLLIYKYQSNGSLLNLFENYIEGKRDFPWRLRLYITGGIARGLNFMYQRSNDKEIIPHGSLKPSNILLGDDMEALISEYGFSKFVDPRGPCVYSHGHMAPEKSFSEQADVYSFGVILLELLTGKTVQQTGKTAEKAGIDLPKWVRSMVREEWTGEVFDKEVSKAAKQWAFPLLNIAMKCVADAPENRPSIAEVLEKIEEAITAHDSHMTSASPLLCAESDHKECCLLHSVIPETWDTPGSNY